MDVCKPHLWWTHQNHHIWGIILRNFKSQKTSVLLPLLKNLVCSKVKYTCPIWNPTDSTNINHLEAVQRQFTSKFQRVRKYNEDLCMPVCIVPYSQRLKQLKLYSLQRWQEHYVIIYMHKIKSRLVLNPGIEPEFNQNCYQFKPWTDRKNGQSSFFMTGPRLYNSHTTGRGCGGLGRVRVGGVWSGLACLKGGKQSEKGEGHRRHNAPTQTHNTHTHTHTHTHTTHMYTHIHTRPFEA